MSDPIDEYIARTLNRRPTVIERLEDASGSGCFIALVLLGISIICLLIAAVVKVGFWLFK